MIRINNHQLHRNKILFNTRITRLFSNGSKKIRNHHALKILPEKEQTAFMAQLPKIIQDATNNDRIKEFFPVNQRLERLLWHILPSGKMVRPHSLIYSYQVIEDHHKTLTSEKMEEIYKLAWCFEMFNSVIIILDDITDNHQTRRGKKAWHMVDDIGLTAVTDSQLIQYSMYELLKKYFSSHRNYIKILENFMRPHAILGLTMEYHLKTFKDFTPTRYNKLTKGKTTPYITIQPLEMATLMANKRLSMSKMAWNVLDHICRLYTLQNDVLDCYGEKLTGKTGTDIQENRCTGLIVMALQKASLAQKKILEECYGSYDNDKIAKVKQVYKEIDVLNEYYKMEQKLYKQIIDDIKNIPDDLTRSLVENYAFVFTYGEIGVPPSWNISYA